MMTLVCSILTMMKLIKKARVARLKKSLMKKKTRALIQAVQKKVMMKSQASTQIVLFTR